MQKQREIRRMRPGEVDSVMLIWLQGNMDAHPFIAASYWQGNMAEVREAILAAEIWVCADGDIQGFIGIVDGYVAGLFVRSDARGLGIGTALLSKARESSERLCLHVYKKNRAAVDFYLHNSFSICAMDVDGNTGEEEYEMQWSRR